MSLATLLVLIFLTKIYHQDTPVAIADWAKNHANELVELLKLKRDRIPHHNTYRRVFQDVISETEFKKLMESYHQQGEAGEILQMDGKALRGASIPGEEQNHYVLSLYDGRNQRVLTQEIVNEKENEIVAAPKLLKRVNLDGKIVTADAMHTQRSISAYIVGQKGDYLWPVKENQERLYQAIQRLFAPDHPKPGFGKVSTDFQMVTKVNCGHGRIEKRSLQTSAMLNDYVDWPGWVRCIDWNDNLPGCAKVRRTRPVTRLSMGLPALLTRKLLPKRYWPSDENIGKSKLVCIIVVM